MTTLSSPFATAWLSFTPPDSALRLLAQMTPEWTDGS